MKSQACLCPIGRDWATNTGCVISLLNKPIYFDKTTVWEMREGI